MDRDTYQALLLDPRWQYRRYEILRRDGKRCTRCRSQVELEVHHRRYIGDRAPWGYEDADLQTLCDPCHRLETLHPGQYEAPRRGEGMVHVSHALKNALNDLLAVYQKREKATSSTSFKPEELEL